MGLYTSNALAVAAYLVAGVLFVLSLRGLSSQETARRGNVYGILGMVIAIGATLTLPMTFHPAVFGAVGIGALVGAAMAARVGMTQMPELVALLHSFVGLAAVLVPRLPVIRKIRTTSITQAAIAITPTRNWAQVSLFDRGIVSAPFSAYVAYWNSGCVTTVFLRISHGLALFLLR
jgi:NAD/NADP transhydrogenase beta subunit